MTYKKLFFLGIFSFLIDLIMIPLRSNFFGYGGFNTSGLIGFIVFFFLIIICLQMFGSEISVWSILAVLILGRYILEIPIRILDFEGTLISLPESIIRTLGFFCGFAYWRLRTPFNLITTFLGISLAVFMFYDGYDFWLHKLNHQTFTGRIEAYKLRENIHGHDQNKQKISNQNFENKLVLLDFWNTRCGVCFRKFPQLQAFYEKYKDDDSIMVLAVNKPLEEDKEDEAFKVIADEGFSFPVLLPEDADLAEKFGVSGYPTTFVVDRRGNVVFKGDIEKAVKMIEELKTSK